jgi:hypothetical protein
MLCFDDLGRWKTEYAEVYRKDPVLSTIRNVNPEAAMP